MILRGRAGTAERCSNLGPRTAAQQAALAAWLIDAPGQSPAWRHYLVSIIHLRPIAGVPPAYIGMPGATHELLLCALDPHHRPNVDDPESLAPLLPVNAECQFAVDTDEQAIRLGELVVKAIVDGVYPAEPPFPQQGRGAWQQIVSETAEHLRTGGHPAVGRGGAG